MTKQEIRERLEKQFILVSDKSEKETDTKEILNLSQIMISLTYVITDLEQRPL